MIEQRSRPIGLWTAGAILMSAVVVTSADYSFFTPLRDARIAAHNQVVAHSAPSPSRYRVLVPMALEGPIRLLASWRPHEKAFERVYGAFHFLALALLLIALFLQLSLWFTAEQALAGALMVGSLVQLALRQQEYDLAAIPASAVFAPHSLLEPVFVAAALVLSWRGRRWWLALVCAVAALNSEASIILPLLYLVLANFSRAAAMTALAYAGIWGVVTLGIHLAVGPTDTTWTLEQTWRANVRHLATDAVNVGLFMGPLWVLAALGARRAPTPVRRATRLIPIYLAVVAMTGLWWDVRLLIGLYPILIPLVLSALFAPRSTDREAAPTWQSTLEGTVTRSRGSAT